MANGGELTYFAQLPLEHEFQDSAPSGIFNGIFGRFFKSTQNSPIDISEARVADNVQSSIAATNCKDDTNSNEASSTGALTKDENEEKISSEVRGISSRFSSLFRSRNPSLVDYNRSSFRRYWMPDSTGKECYECQERFTAFRRRHHCRLCGQIFCAKCCSIQVPGSLLGYMGDLRVCGYCAKVVVTHLPQGMSDSESQQQEQKEELREQPQSTSVVSTVAAGSFLWLGELSTTSYTKQVPFNEKVEADGPSTSSQLPSLLSVLDLANQKEFYTKSPPLNVSVEQYSTLIDDYEPDWVKSIEMSTTRSANKTDDNNFTTTSNSDACSNDNCDSCLSGTDDNMKTYGSGLAPESDEIAPFDIPLEKAFEERIQSLLLYLFDREMLDSTVWWDVIWPMSRQIAMSVKANVESRKDHMNILKYVHIKKVWVDDTKPSALVINGVVCSKSISHAHMPDAITNASVLALAGGLEYERVSEKLSLIEPIVMQENEYLSKQVERIMAYRPSIVLMEKNVAHIAVRMLLRAGVTLVSNLKTQVLHRIARCTRADVMPSLDVQILQQKVGFCSSFKQQTIRLANGKRKTILIFSECSSDLGCSVILRSNSQWQLRCAKRILRFVILALYSGRLEVQFLSLFGTSLSKRIRDCVVCSLNVDEPDSDEDSFANRLKKCPLSTSPFIDFGVPFLETAKGRRCALRPYFKHPLYKHFTKEDIAKIKMKYDSIEASLNRNNVEQNEENLYPLHKFVSNKKLWGINEDDVASYRAFSGKMFKKRIDVSVDVEKKLNEIDFRFYDDVFDPLMHQKIAILFGSFSPKSPNAPLFCVRPWVVQMEHYGTNDMTLGDFLRKFCFNKDYQCPSTNCEVPMLEHARKIVYRNVCIEITTQDCVRQLDESSGFLQQSSNQTTDTVICWHYCPSCKASSAVKQLSELASRMSFSRYIDYLANGGMATCNIYAFSKKCEHCCFHQHDHFFAYNTEVVFFKMQPVKPFHVQFSPVVCTVDAVMFTRRFVADKENEIRQTAEAIFKIMDTQLANFLQSSDSTKFISYYDKLKLGLDDARNQFNGLIKQFDPSGVLSSDVLTIRSNDAVYIKALNIETRCRYIVQRLIDLWNEQSTSLTQAIRTYKKGLGTILSHTPAANVSSGEAIKSEQVNGSSAALKSSSSVCSLSEFELSTIESPFLPQLHLGLPPPLPGMTAVVRDIVNRKGSAHPDIGSIIAYALSSADYETKLQKIRDLGKNNHLIKTPPVEFESTGLQEHIEVDFSDDRAQYFVKIYYAESFHLLRKLLFVEGEECFIRSLSVSSGWNPQGGKSGASFYRTQVVLFRDERFVFKQMSRFEIQSFLKFAPNYFNYISTAVTENKLTTLCKVYGVYRIGYKNKVTGNQLKIDMLVMEYLFYKRNVKQVWDLKGSQRNRMASEGKKTADLVLLDENLIKDLWNNQLYVHPYSKAALNMAISNDSHFLSAQHVMDYSLLVGVDETNSELILGIVDYMRTYTLDKKLESWVKIVAIPGSLLPTVISPVMYCTRFSDAMDIYFPVAPDQWTGLRTSVSD
uniref:1-phosphatidylinositol-3-phosphate 5-kinase n=1 Tax=Syphacia muris TaxID=451379 RepID=A0A0N5AAJ0_9BILA